MDCTEALAPLKAIELLNARLLEGASSAWRSPEIGALSRRYQEVKSATQGTMGFNVFTLVSDTFYRENFHSDILAAFLDPRGAHQQQGLFLNQFLECLKQIRPELEPSLYRDATVFREKGRIDILILAPTTQRAIIVENKLNNAVDQERQLPRYLETVTAWGYACDAIVYLTVHGESGPATEGWTEEEKAKIAPLLSPLGAVSRRGVDLLCSWIEPCLRAIPATSDAAFLLEHYARLLRQMRRDVMNSPLMEEFYTLMCDAKTYRQTLSLQEMLDDLLRYRARRIADTFRYDRAPFQNNWVYQEKSAGFNELHTADGAHFGIDIMVQPEEYKFQFWDRKDQRGSNGRAQAVLTRMGVLHDYQCEEGGCYLLRFPFPEKEEALYMHIRSFKKALAEALGLPG